MEWTIATARQNFSALLKASQLGVQPIYKHKQLIAAVIDAPTYERLQGKQTTLAQSFQTLRTILAETQDDEGLASLPRKNRANSFLETLGN